MKIGIDFDEVLAEFVKGYFNFYRLKTGIEIKFEDVFSYNLWEVMGISRDEAFKIADEFYDSEHFSELALVPGAKDTLIALSKEHELLIVTSRPVRIAGKTEQYLRRNIPEIHPEIFYAGDIFREQGKPKAELCAQLSLDHFVEDNLRYAQQCAEKRIRVFLLDKSWNQGELNGNVTRVKNWSEILNKLK